MLWAETDLLRLATGCVTGEGSGEFEVDESVGTVNAMETAEEAVGGK